MMARPNLSYLKSLFLFLFGLPAGALTGLTAIGSSVVLAPGVRWLLGLRPVRTGATALAATAFAAFAGLLSYTLHGNVRWGLALLLTVAQVVGAGWGARLVTHAPVLLRLHLLWAVLAIAAGLALAAKGVRCWRDSPGPRPSSDWTRTARHFTSGPSSLGPGRPCQPGRGTGRGPAGSRRNLSASSAAPSGAGDGAGRPAAGGAARHVDLRPAR